MKEIWKSVKGYEGIAWVSSFGRVKYYTYSGKGEERITTGVEKDGYKLVFFGNELHRIHRLVAIAFIENCNNKPFVNHKDGNKSNNNVSNLEWVTTSENLKHAYDTGLRGSTKGQSRPSMMGENNPRYGGASFESKLKASISQSGLTIQDIFEIDDLLKNKVKSKEIEEKYNIGWRVVRNIKHRRGFYKEFFEKYK